MTRVYLASTSPRRLELLLQAGFDVCVYAPEVDDGHLRPGGVSPEQWVASLAYAKAMSVWPQLVDEIDCGDVLLAADTVCLCDDQILGQPTDADDARRMLLAMRHSVHQTMTGVCLLSPNAARTLFVDTADVTIGDVSDEQIEAYVKTEQWRGKAGGYNLAERVEADWPIQCEGDPATVMGLPVQRLKPLISGSHLWSTNLQPHI